MFFPIYAPCSFQLPSLLKAMAAPTLLFSGYGSHCTKELLDFCDNHHIIPFSLPPHTTHLLQLLDMVCFQPYKHFHAEAVDATTRTGCSDFNKLEFFVALSSIHKQTFKRTTILSAFCQTGLIPFNPNIVLSKLPATTLSPPSTPPPATPELPTVPLTIRSLKRQASELWNYSDPTGPTSSLLQLTHPTPNSCVTTLFSSPPQRIGLQLPHKS